MQDQDADENMPVHHSFHILDNCWPAAGTVGVDMSGASDTLNVDLDAHIIINTNAADDGVSDGTVALDQKVNDDLTMGPPGASCAIDATPRMCANT